ncbi:MAG: hypothetical protein Q3976_03985 [Corynebacterium sp.]|nr:hypothetical protein [Corynebacterium sp.]
MAGRASKLLSVLVLSATLGLVACGSDDAENSEATAATTSTESATFEPKDVDTKVVENINSPERDEGLNINVELLYTASNQQGSGSVIYVLVTNRNEMPLPNDAIGQPTLRVSGSDVSPVTSGTQELDLPLKPGATVNLAYAFDTSYNSLYDATFTIGNLEFSGNLNNVS